MDEELEQLLSQTSGRPSSTLRTRVLQAVSCELRQDTAPHWSRVLLAVAAIAILWIHCTWSAALNTRIDSPNQGAADVVEASQQIHALLPELSNIEARQMALRMTAGSTRPTVRTIQWKDF